MKVRDRDHDTEHRTPDVSSEIMEFELPSGRVYYRSYVVLCNRDDAHDARYTLSIVEAERLADELLNVCRVLREENKAMKGKL